MKIWSIRLTVFENEKISWKFYQYLFYILSPSDDETTPFIEQRSNPLPEVNVMLVMIVLVEEN